MTMYTIDCQDQYSQAAAAVAAVAAALVGRRAGSLEA